MAQAIGRILHDRIVITNISFDVIIPIPIHGKKLKTRGYDQAVLMALELSKLTGVAADINAVKRSKMTEPNKKLGAEQRAENMRGAFVVTESDTVTRGIHEKDPCRAYAGRAFQRRPRDVCRRTRRPH